MAEWMLPDLGSTASDVSVTPILGMGDFCARLDERGRL